MGNENMFFLENAWVSLLQPGHLLVSQVSCSEEVLRMLECARWSVVASGGAGGGQRGAQRVAIHAVGPARGFCSVAVAVRLAASSRKAQRRRPHAR